MLSAGTSFCCVRVHSCRKVPQVSGPESPTGFPELLVKVFFGFFCKNKTVSQYLVPKIYKWSPMNFTPKLLCPFPAAVIKR